MSSHHVGCSDCSDTEDQQADRYGDDESFTPPFEFLLSVCDEIIEVGIRNLLRISNGSDVAAVQASDSLIVWGRHVGANL